MYIMYIFSQMTTVSNINGIPKGGKRTLSGNVLEMKVFGLYNDKCNHKGSSLCNGAKPESRARSDDRKKTN